MASRILTVPQAAEKLQMSVDVVREYLRTGRLPGRKVGRAWRVLESELEQWIVTGQTERRRPYISALGFMKRYPGRLSSERLMAEKRAEVEEEERRWEEKQRERTRRSEAA